MNIGYDAIAIAIKFEACVPAIEWLEAGERSYEELVALYPYWAVWAYRHWLVPTDWARAEGHLDAHDNFLCVDCIDCTGCAGCAACVRCTDCSGCVDCVRCADCSGCVECVGCTGCTDCVACTACTDRVETQ